MLTDPHQRPGSLVHALDPQNLAFRRKTPYRGFDEIVVLNVVDRRHSDQVTLPPHDLVGAAFEGHRPHRFAGSTVETDDVKSAGHHHRFFAERHGADPIVGLRRPQVLASVVPKRQPTVPAACEDLVFRRDVQRRDRLLQRANHPRCRVQVHERETAFTDIRGSPCWWEPGTIGCAVQIDRWPGII